MTARPRSADAAAALASDAASGKARDSGRPTHPSTITSRPFVVIIHGTRRAEWGRFHTHAEAAAVAGKLRAHGFNAFVRDEREAAP